MHSPRNPDNVLPHRRCGATPKPTKRIERPVREAKKALGGPFTAGGIARSLERRATPRHARLPLRVRIAGNGVRTIIVGPRTDSPAG
jgi:hypothetical protein